jgi:hypothetical protein
MRPKPSRQAAENYNIAFLERAMRAMPMMNKGIAVQYEPRLATLLRLRIISTAAATMNSIPAKRMAFGDMFIFLS